MAKGGSHNCRDIIRRMQQRKKQMVSGLSDAARELRPILNAEAKQVLNEKIYSVEIPFKKRVDEKIKKKFKGTSTQRHKGSDIRQWKRLGNGGGILSAERAITEGVVVILVNSKKYAEARYTLGTPEGRQIRTPGVQSVQWHHEALIRQRSRILQVRRKYVLKVLRVA